MSHPVFPPRGLYAITTSSGRSQAALTEAVEQAIEGGAACVQYRNKASAMREQRAEALAVGAVCRRHGVPFIVNDALDVALEAGADGLHIGAGDIDYASARAALGEHGIIGVSCYNSLGRARRAEGLGADYVAFGRFFTSPTKPGAVQAGTALLQRAKARLSLPIVAIGGITPENGGALLAAGADLLAAIDGLFGQREVRAAALRYARLFVNPLHGVTRDPVAGAVR